MEPPTPIQPATRDPRAQERAQERKLRQAKASARFGQLLTSLQDAPPGHQGRWAESARRGIGAGPPNDRKMGSLPAAFPAAIRGEEDQNASPVLDGGPAAATQRGGSAGEPGKDQPTSPDADDGREQQFARALRRETRARGREISEGEPGGGILGEGVADRLARQLAAKMIEKDLEGSITPLVFSLVVCAFNDAVDVIDLAMGFPLDQLLNVAVWIVVVATKLFLKWGRGWGIFSRLLLWVVILMVDSILGLGVLPFWTTLAAYELVTEVERRAKLRLDLPALGHGTRILQLSDEGTRKYQAASRQVWESVSGLGASAAAVRGAVNST